MSAGAAADDRVSVAPRDFHALLLKTVHVFQKSYSRGITYSHSHCQ